MSSNRLVIIGLDGGTFDVIEPLVAQGKLPTLKRLIEEGLYTELRSTMPPATLPAWTSFLTAQEPQHHGVSDIFVHPPNSYALVPSNATMRTTATFLWNLAQAGLSVVSLGVPGTFPPEPLPGGLVVSGFDAPGARAAQERAVHPRSFYPRLESLGGWRYATFNELAGADDQDPVLRLQAAIKALHKDIEAKERVLLDIYEQRQPDVCFVHLQASDTVGHHLWHAYDTRSPRHEPRLESLGQAVPSVYQRLDTLMGRLLERAGPNARVLVVSDHGMGGASVVAVHLNRWLHQQQLLAFRTSAVRSAKHVVSGGLRKVAARLPVSVLGRVLEQLPTPLRNLAMGLARNQNVDFAQTQAFSDELDYAPALWLNRKSRFAKGMLNDAQADALADKLAEQLTQELKHPQTGAPLIKKVHRGPPDARTPMPDLIIEPAWPQGYRPSFLVSSEPGAPVRLLTPQEFSAPKGSGMPGVHRREGIFIAHGPGLPAMQLPTFDIAQAGTLVYALVGRQAPNHAVPMPAFLTNIANALGQATSTPSQPTPLPADAYSAADNNEVTERLRNLGYIE